VSLPPSAVLTVAGPLVRHKSPLTEHVRRQRGCLSRALFTHHIRVYRVVGPAARPATTSGLRTMPTEIRRLQTPGGLFREARDPRSRTTEDAGCWRRITILLPGLGDSSVD